MCKPKVHINREKIPYSAVDLINPIRKYIAFIPLLFTELSQRIGTITTVNRESDLLYFMTFVEVINSWRIIVE